MRLYETSLSYPGLVVMLGSSMRWHEGAGSALAWAGFTFVAFDVAGCNEKRFSTKTKRKVELTRVRKKAMGSPTQKKRPGELPSGGTIHVSPNAAALSVNP